MPESPTADTRRPTAVRSTPRGVVLVALDSAGGPVLVRDAAGAEVLWLGVAGRVCDVGTRYGGRPGDILAAWIWEMAGPAGGSGALRLAPAQLTDVAERLLHGARLRKLRTAGILEDGASAPSPAAPPPPPVAPPGPVTLKRQRRPAVQVGLFAGGAS